MAISVLVYILGASLMLALPVALWVFLKRRISASWRVFGIGAITFILSQVLHVPFNSFILGPFLVNTFRLDEDTVPSGFSLLIVAVSYGLSAGVFEEVSRYIVFHFWLTAEQTTWKTAISLGAGHGGCESIIVGLSALGTLGFMIYLRGIDDMSKITDDPKKAEALEKAMENFWSSPWYVPLCGAVERVTAMTFHVSAALLVWRSFYKLLWLGAAIAFHTAIDTIAVVGAVESWNTIVLEAFLGLLVIPLATLIIRHFQDENGFIPLAQEEDGISLDTEHGEVLSTEETGVEKEIVCETDNRLTT